MKNFNSMKKSIHFLENGLCLVKWALALSKILLQWNIQTGFPVEPEFSGLQALQFWNQESTEVHIPLKNRMGSAAR